MEVVREAMKGMNKIENKYLLIYIVGKRMSGEMCTSLGNGFTNYAASSYVNKELCGATVFEMDAEGDDGVGTSNGSIPKSEHYKLLGLDIKLEIKSEIEEASFCGLVFDREDMKNVTDVRKVIASFGWVSGRYANAKKSTLMTLLRCKGLSLIYQYPGCPVLQSLGKYALRVTKSFDVRHLIEKDRSISGWERQKLRDALKGIKQDYESTAPIGIRSRFLVEKLYGMTVEQQIKLEKYLDSLNFLTPLKLDEIDHLFPESWSDYFMKYTSIEDVTSPNVCYPAVVFPTLKDFKVEWDQSGYRAKPSSKH
jgi:hypothetical protein